jgi:hypothetical protein
MNDKILHILEQIKALEEEIQSELNKQGSRWFYEIKGKRIEFERAIREKHRSLKQGLFYWFLTARPLNYLTAPIIYGMAVPLVIFDICVTFYQLTCFPIYGISRVRRSDYIVFDRRHLAYLNIIEKFDCLYCSYGNGLVAYATEILARTEQYFCPIKHAQKVAGTHARYQYFLDFGDAADLHKKFEEIRVALVKEDENATKL